MSKIKVFCFGFGQVAKYFIKKIVEENKTLDQKFNFDNSNLLRNTFPYKVSDPFANMIS